MFGTPFARRLSHRFLIHHDAIAQQFRQPDRYIAARCRVRLRPTLGRPLMPHFFATANDLLPVLAAVESRRRLVYTRTGHSPSPEVFSFPSGESIETLRAPATSETASTAAAYLVTEVDVPIVARPIQVRGEDKLCWAIDQLANADSTVLWHGGVWRSDILLSGRVASCSKSAPSQSLQRAFENQIKRQFSRIKAFYVGDEAARLLDSGVRLTMSAQSPREYDLTR